MDQLDRIKSEFDIARSSLKCRLHCRRKDRTKAEVQIGKLDSLIYSYSNPLSLISEDEFVHKAEGILSTIYKESVCTKTNLPCSSLEPQIKILRPRWYSRFSFWSKSK